MIFCLLNLSNWRSWENYLINIINNIYTYLLLLIVTKQLLQPAKRHLSIDYFARMFHKTAYPSLLFPPSLTLLNSPLHAKDISEHLPQISFLISIRRMDFYCQTTLRGVPKNKKSFFRKKVRNPLLSSSSVKKKR